MSFSPQISSWTIIVRPHFGTFCFDTITMCFLRLILLCCGFDGTKQIEHIWPGRANGTSRSSIRISLIRMLQNNAFLSGPRFRIWPFRMLPDKTRPFVSFDMYYIIMIIDDYRF